jgi:hypothetical protein
MAMDGVKTIVPGHGPVLSSWDYVRSEKGLIDTLLSQVRSAMHAGFTEANQVDSVTQQELLPHPRHPPRFRRGAG